MIFKLHYVDYRPSENRSVFKYSIVLDKVKSKAELMKLASLRSDKLYLDIARMAECVLSNTGNKTLELSYIDSSNLTPKLVTDLREQGLEVTCEVLTLGSIGFCREYNYEIYSENGLDPHPPTTDFVPTSNYLSNLSQKAQCSIKSNVEICEMFKLCRF